MSRLRKERDVYLESLHSLTRSRVKPLTEAELADLQQNGITQEQLLAEIDNLFAPRSSGA